MQSTAMQGNATQRPLEFSAVAAFERELLRAETSERAKGIAAQRNAMHGKAKQGTAKQRTTLINHLESTMEHDDIITQLIEHDYFTYGATIKPVDLLAHFGLAATTDEEMAGWSLDAIRGRIQKDSLMEVSIASKVRDRLLDQGRYLGGVKGEYRVFLPSENARVADNYLDRSTSAQRRAHRLRASTPHASIEFSSSNGRAAIAAARNERQAKKKV